VRPLGCATGPHTGITAGYELGVNAQKAKLLFDEMTDWANRSPFFEDDAVEEEIVKKEIGKFAVAVKECAKLAG
jgi:hypothetical protein